MVAYGFGVMPIPSFVRVILYRGRYLLLDGNLRCYEFLRRSVRLLPVLSKEVDSVEHIPRNQAYLPPRTYLRSGRR
jgi:hypothetical protein